MTDLIERLGVIKWIEQGGLDEDDRKTIDEAIAALEAPLPDDIKKTISAFKRYCDGRESLLLSHVLEMLERLWREKESLLVSYGKSVRELERRIEELEKELDDARSGRMPT